MRPSISACGLAVVLMFPGPLAAQPPGQLRVARLIKQLGSESFVERTSATGELEQIGPAAREKLAAAAHDPNPDIRLQAKDLLARLALRDLWTATEVSCPGGAMPASKLMALVSQQTGNHLLLGDQYGTFHEKDVTAGPEKQAFWPLVDRICRETGNRMRPHFDPHQPGLVIVSGETGSYPLAYAGPIRGQLTTARRNFSEELSYENLASEVSHVFQLGVQLVWEDRFRLVAYRSQPDVVSAVAPDGSRLPLLSAAPATWNVAGPGTRQISTTLSLQPPPTAARQLDSLVLHWGLIAVGDMATLEVADLASREPHFQDDLELIVESLEPNGAGQFALSLRISRNLAIPEPAEVIFQENQIELFDAQQKAFRIQGQTNTLSEDGAKMVVNFIGESSDSAPQKLTFSYPRLRSHRNVELVFRHVPLPVARPQ